MGVGRGEGWTVVFPETGGLTVDSLEGNSLPRRGKGLEGGIFFFAINSPKVSAMISAPRTVISLEGSLSKGLVWCRCKDPCQELSGASLWMEDGGGRVMAEDAIFDPPMPGRKFSERESGGGSNLLA